MLRQLHHLLLCLGMLIGLALTSSVLKAIFQGRFTDNNGFWTTAGIASCVVLTAALAFRLYLWFRRRWQDHKFRPFQLLIVVMVCTWLLVTFLAQPYHSARVQLGLGIGLGVWAGLWHLPRLIHPSLATPPLCLALLTQVCLVILGLELGLRMMAGIWAWPIFARANSDVMQTLQTYRKPAGQLHYGFPMNEGGHYDETFSKKTGDEKLVLAIGDSFSAGVVPHQYHFTTVAEQKLNNTRIHNMGFHSIGPMEYLFLLRSEGLSLQPDLLVINLFAGNDLMDSQRQRHDQEQLRFWFDPNNLLLFLVPQRIGRLSAEPQTKTPAAQASEFPWLEDPLLEPPQFSDAGYLDIEVRRAQKVMDPGMGQQYRIMFQILQQIREAAGSIPMLVMLIPDECQVNDELWHKLQGPLDTTKLERNLPQKLIGQWLAEQEIPCLDLLPLLREAKPWSDGKLHLYHRNDSHFNRRGNAVAGKALAEFLQEQLR